MQSDGNLDSGDPQQYRRYYDEAMQAIRADFEANPHRIQSGAVAIRARASAVDQLVRNLWTDATPGVALVAVGGYGRRELFPFSDVDLMFLLNPRVPERTVKNSIRMLNQALWDCGVRVSPMTRTLAECTRFDPENVEFTLSLLDSRFVAGDQSLTSALVGKAIPKLLAHERKRCIARLLQVTETRHAKFGDTLFHLEPNVKETPGGLRDVHVCAWLDRLTEATLSVSGESEEFVEAREFLLLVRAFLHFRHNRDDNTLDWRTQDEAAANRLGAPHGSDDPAFWMRLYFRHARAIERRITQATEELTAPARGLLSALSGIRRTRRRTANSGYENAGNRILFSEIGGKDAGPDPANDPEVAFAIFAEIARTGARLPCSTELRLEGALPVLSAQIEDGPGLWLQLQSILTGPFAGRALRAMHAIGILELVIPEFHGIDALVIRDAYHRYTVDEHTFVLIDTLHALSTESAIRDPWATRFAALLRDLPHPALLFLAALLHDTGKGHLSDAHATESERMARNLLDRLEVDPYEAALVLDIIRNHLEMSSIRRPFVVLRRVCPLQRPCGC
jgi:[protein-PII] uridylyltransferase